MILIDNSGRMVSKGGLVEELRGVAKKYNIIDFSDKPFPHFKVKKKDIKDLLGKHDIKKVKPEDVQYYGKRQK